MIRLPATVRTTQRSSLHLIISAVVALCVSSAFADDLSQLYEKAYFLETAKGETEEAMKIYRKIAVSETTDENRGAIIEALERLLVLNKREQLQTVQLKVDDFNLNPTIRDHIINTFGKPERYANNNKEYSADELPHTGYTMYYPEGFSIQVSFNRIHSIQFKEPVYTAGGITIGSTEQEVLKEFPPEKYLDYKTRLGSGFESGVIYTNISPSLGAKSYCTTNNIRFYIANGKVTTMSLKSPPPKAKK